MLDDVVAAWRRDGFAVLPGYLADALAPALDELTTCFPTPDGFHDRTDPRHIRFRGDEFAGIDSFPFASVELGLLALHPRLLDLAGALVGDDVRLYSAEVWAKYTDAADYDQRLHRDFLNHTLVVPSAAYPQAELFVYLVDVAADLGPTRLVARRHTADVPVLPNWFPRTDGDGDRFNAAQRRPDLYAAETPALGPAGTVVAWSPDTVHRGTGLTREPGALFTLHACFRPAAMEWGQRVGWVDRSHTPDWYRFVGRANPRQLGALGFPPPGHPFWTPDTLAATALRYPDLDLRPWRENVGSGA